MNETYFVGLDLGQSQDHTALAIVERAELVGQWDAAVHAKRKETALRLRFLERLPLGTPYPEIVERVGAVMGSKPLSETTCRLAVDATGVGRPVVDLLRCARMGCELMPVLITGGEAEGQSDGYYKVPKRDLIVGLQVLFQAEELRIAAGIKEGPALVRELQEMQVKVSISGHEQYGVWRAGEHDDLVLATAMACWAVRKAHPPKRKGEVEYWTRWEPTRVVKVEGIWW